MMDVPQPIPAVVSAQHAGNTHQGTTDTERRRISGSQPQGDNEEPSRDVNNRKPMYDARAVYV